MTKLLSQSLITAFLFISLFSTAFSQETAEAFYRQGVEQLKNTKYDPAIESFTKAIKLNPEFLEAYLERSKARQNNQRDLAGALSDLEKVLELNPSHGEAHFERALTRNAQFLKQFDKPKIRSQKEAEQQEELILSDLNLAINYGFKTVESYSWRAQQFKNQRNFKEAVADYDAAILLAPDNYWLYINRSNAKANTGDLEGSIQDLLEVVTRYNIALNNPEKTAAQNPDVRVPVNKQGMDKHSIAMALTNLAGRLMFKENESLALIAINQAIELEPKYFSAYSARGGYRMIFDDLNDAIEDYNKAIELQGKQIFPHDLMRRGIAYSLQGNEAAAQVDFDKAFQLDESLDKTRINYYLELTRRQRAQKKIKVELPK